MDERIYQPLMKMLEAATEIHEKGICLEEYLESLHEKRLLMFHHLPLNILIDIHSKAQDRS